MQDDPYSLAELARLADVTPRTIRYYVAQGLLPAPEAAGPATRYGEGHLARLRLIRRLQRDHLPLAEIRGRLELMGDREVQDLLDATDSVTPEPPMAGDETLSYVRALMARSGVSPRTLGRAAEAPAAYPAVPAPPIRSIPGLAALHALQPPTGEPPAGFFIDPEADGGPDHPVLPTTTGPTPPSSSSDPPRPTADYRSTWERLVLNPDVELHVRRPLDRITHKRVDQLTRIARELFDQEP